MTDQVRAAGYVRVSTDRQAKEGLSLDEQQRQVEAYIEAQGWQHAGTFIEAGVSGRKDDRPELARVIELATTGGLDALVIPKLDRLGRSTRHLLATVERLEAAGVRLVSLRDNIDTSTPSGRLLLRMLASVAEFESDMIGERVASVSVARAQQGKNHGRASYGYRAAGKDGLVIEPGEAAIVRRIFREYNAGKSQRRIEHDLNAEGLQPQRGEEWHQGTISKLLGNPVYAGMVRVNGVEYQGTHEPLIDLETWRKATQLREATSRTGRGRTPSGGHVLADGMLRCGRCGSVMNANTKPTRTPGRRYEVYTCRGRRAGCSQPIVKRAPIDQAIWSFFMQVALDVDATKAAITKAHDAKLSEIAVLRQQAERESQRTADALRRIERDYRNDKITAEKWDRLDDTLTGELEAAQAQVARLNSQEQTLAAELEQVDTEAAVLDELTALRAMVVGEAREGSRQSVDGFRVALRRMFEPFVLVSVVRRDGRTEIVPGPPDTRPGWYGHQHPDLRLDAQEQPDGSQITYLLSPVVRNDVMDGYPTAAEPFPALRRAALALRRPDVDTLTT